jgi:hypothetical protein
VARDQRAAGGCCGGLISGLLRGRKRTLRSPVKLKRSLAKGKPVQVSANGIFQGLKLVVRRCLDAHVQRLVGRFECRAGIGRMAGSSRIFRKYDRSGLCCELDLQIVRPMLAQLLQIATSADRRHRCLSNELTHCDFPSRYGRHDIVYCERFAIAPPKSLVGAGEPNGSGKRTLGQPSKSSTLHHQGAVAF